MSDTLPRDLIPTSQAADLLNLSPQALSHWRTIGIGPKAHPVPRGKITAFLYSRREVIEHHRGRLGIEGRIERLEDRLDRLEAS